MTGGARKHTKGRLSARFDGSVLEFCFTALMSYQRWKDYNRHFTLLCVAPGLRNN